MRKKAAPFLVAILLLLFLAGCATRHTENYLRTYRDFLNYSLGDFEVIYDGTDSVHQQWRGTTDTYRLWHLQYMRENGEEKEFRFNNMNNMYESVIRTAGNIGSDSLINSDMVHNYFSEAEFGLDHSQPTSVVFYMRPAADLPIQRTWQSAPRPADIEYAQPADPSAVTDSENGLQLSSVTSKQLVDDWGLTLQVYVTHRGEEDYADVVERLQAMLRTLSTYLGQDYIEVDLRACGGQLGNERDVDPEIAWELSFSGYYNRITDSFETRTVADILDLDGVHDEAYDE